MLTRTLSHYTGAVKPAIEVISKAGVIPLSWCYCSGVCGVFTGYRRSTSARRSFEAMPDIAAVVPYTLVARAILAVLSSGSAGGQAQGSVRGKRDTDAYIELFFLPYIVLLSVAKRGPKDLSLLRFGLQSQILVCRIGGPSSEFRPSAVPDTKPWFQTRTVDTC